MAAIPYKKIREARVILIDELKHEFGLKSITPEWLLVVEARLQTLIRAQTTVADLKSEQAGWQSND